jgi:uncharacterized peroxidase-related enzyme
VLSHAAVAAELLQDRARVDAVLESPETAPIPEAEKALFAFVEKVNGASYRLEKQDIDALIAAGWSEEAVYDAISVCALFNFYNRWCDATGVHPMAPEHHAMGGKRMAERGYVPPPA